MLLSTLYICALIVILLSVCNFRSIYLTWKYPKWNKYTFVPILGHIGFLRNLNGSAEGYRRMITEVSDYSGQMLYCMNYKLIGFYKPHHMEIILKHPASQHKAFQYKFLKDLVGNSTLCLNGDEWRVRRKAISPVMHRSVIASYVGDVSNYAELLADEFKPNVGKVFNARHMIAKCAIDMFMDIVIGFDNASENSEVMAHMDRQGHNFVKRFMSLWKYSDFVYNWTDDGKALNHTISYAEKTVGKIISARNEIYKNNIMCEADMEGSKLSPHRYKLIDFLISLQCSHRAILHECIIFIIGGYDTIQTTIGFSLMMIAMHPNVQEKVYQEVLDVLGPDRCVEYNDLNKFVYLKKVINETLRVFPATPNVARLTTDEITIDGHIIPKNTNLGLSIFTLHRSELYWPDPLKFDPERFNSEEINKRHNYCFIPFLAGNRNCFGIPFAMMHLVTTLAILLRRYQWFTSYKSVEEIRVDLDIVLCAVDGVMLRPEIRKT